MPLALAAPLQLPFADNLETDRNHDLWPDGWSDPEHIEWIEEDGNHFLRLTSPEPDKTLMLYRQLVLPVTDDLKALEVSLRWRVSNLKPGKKAWFDARLIMDFKDRAGRKLKPKPGAIYSRKNTRGWVTRSTKFLVPEGAVMLEFMPSLFQVRSGTLDIDDIEIRATDPEPILAARAARKAAAERARVPHEEPDRARWPSPLHVSGTQVLNAEGQPVWLQGLNIPSLEWNPRGEQVHKSTVVAIDDWKANVIRIPVRETFWFGAKQDDGGKAYREIVDQMITLAANRGAYAILDLHRYRAPLPAHIEFWKDAARRYRNHPAVLFDLLNEPHDISWAVWRDGGRTLQHSGEDQAAFRGADDHPGNNVATVGMQDLLDAVRSTGARNVVVVGGLDYAYDLSGILRGYALDDPKGHGIIYASHVYPWKRRWQHALLDAAKKYPVLLGEVGGDAKKMGFIAANRQEDVQTWAPAMLGLIQQHRLHWTGWSFHPRATPRLLLDWEYTPTPFWGQLAKDALHGKAFPAPQRLR